MFARCVICACGGLGFARFRGIGLCGCMRRCRSGGSRTIHHAESVRRARASGVAHMRLVRLAAFRISAIRYDPRMIAHTGQRDHMRGARCRVDQCGQVAFRFGLREFLDCLAGGDHQHHGPCGPVFLHGHRRGDRDDRQQIDADVSVPQIVDHALDRHDDRVCDQRDHQPLPDAGIEGIPAERGERGTRAPRSPRFPQCQRNGGDDGDGK